MKPELVELVGASVKLKRAGRRWIGLCPFHKEKTPSFNIFFGRHAGWLWACQGCGEHGDAITWLRKTRGLTYAQAAVELGRPGAWEPDPAMLAARQMKEVAEANWQAFLDRNPEFPTQYRWLIAGA